MQFTKILTLKYRKYLQLKLFATIIIDMLFENCPLHFKQKIELEKIHFSLFY